MNVGRLAATAAAGGALGAGTRAWLTSYADSDLAVTLAINVAGCALLALLPAVGFVRRNHAWSTFLGTGFLGGFTTMSTAVVLPIATLSPGRAVGYLALTLISALLAAQVFSRLAAQPPALVDEDR